MMSNTIRKLAKTNGITDRIFSSVIIADENNSVSKSIGIYRRNLSEIRSVYTNANILLVYTDRISDGL